LFLNLAAFINLKPPSAPTGSGKTVLFELGIIHAMNQNVKQVKCVYIAPTKVPSLLEAYLNATADPVLRRCAPRDFAIGLRNSNLSA
jgi:hypothetical protein